MSDDSVGCDLKAGARLKRGMRGAYDSAAVRYAEYIAPTFRPVALRVLDLARPNTDDLHIDLATGSGTLPALADERHWATCIWPWRAAIDLSGEMLHLARQVALTTHLVQGDLERLPLGSGVADLLTLCFALHHLPAPRLALAEFRRVLRPTGRLVLAAWSDEMSPLWQAFDAWFEEAGLGESRRPEQTRRPMNTVETLREALVEADFGSVKVSRERLPIDFPALADFWEWRVSFPATYRAIGTKPPAERERLKHACLARLQPLAPDGTVHTCQDVLFAVAL